MSDLNTLDRQLRTSLEMPDVSFDRPIDEIVRRGTTMKRRRRALAVAAPTAALMVAVAVAVPLLPMNSASRDTTTAVPSNVDPGWGAQPLSLSPVDLAGVTEECAGRGRAEGGPARVMADSEPLAADRLASGAIALWKGAHQWVLCTPHREGGTWRADQLHAVQVFPLVAGDPDRVATVEFDSTLGWYDKAGQSEQTRVLEAGWVRSDVDRLVIDTGSTLVEAMLVGDRFVAWLPAKEPFVTKTDNGTETDARSVTLNAYDAQGHLLGSTRGW